MMGTHYNIGDALADDYEIRTVFSSGGVGGHCRADSSQPPLAGTSLQIVAERVVAGHGRPSDNSVGTQLCSAPPTLLSRQWCMVRTTAAPPIKDQCDQWENYFIKWFYEINKTHQKYYSVVCRVLKEAWNLWSDSVTHHPTSDSFQWCNDCQLNNKCSWSQCHVLSLIQPIMWVCQDKNIAWDCLWETRDKLFVMFEEEVWSRSWMF